MGRPQEPKGKLCKGCPRFEEKRCTPSSSGNTKPFDVLIIADQPDDKSAVTNTPFLGHEGKIVTTAVAGLKTKEDYKYIECRYTYAVQCMDPDDAPPNKDVLANCNTYLASTILVTKPKVIIAMGAAVMRQFGFKNKHKDARGKFFTHPKYNIPVLVTFSQKALLANPGLFETFKLDVANAFNKVLQGPEEVVTLETLSKNYRVPKTVEEAVAVCDEIVSYSQDNANPDTWAISVDTETTTLYPEKKSAKIIGFCFGWGNKLATTILYDHPHAPQEYLDRLPEVHAAIVRVLQCNKPKIFHNAKFDLRFIEFKYNIPVVNVVWDTLLGEHLLDEDKKGSYGLKALTAGWLPEYCGYEDKLHDLLTLQAGISQVEATDKEIQDLEKVISEDHPDFLEDLRTYREELVVYTAEQEDYIENSAEYARALDEYEFVVAYLRGIQAAWKVAVSDWPKGKRGKPKKPTKWFTKPQKPKAVRKPQRPKDPRTKKEQQISKDAGFENVPVNDLQVYGAVDADVTRQLARIQKIRIAKEKSRVAALMRTHAIPASRVLGRMEYGGMRVDQPYIDVLDAGLRKIVDATEGELYQMAGTNDSDGKPINLNNPATLGNILYNWGWTHPDGDKMDPYTNGVLTKSGQYSTAEKVLRPLVDYVDSDKIVPTREAYFVERLLRYRKASKALNTFLANIRALSKRDGFLHTQFHLNGTGTGRLSCVAGDTVLNTNQGTFRISDPALQGLTDLQILTHKNRWQRVSRVFSKGHDHMFLVTTATGERLKCTADHRFLTPTGWNYLRDLTVGDEVKRHYRGNLRTDLHNRAAKPDSGLGEVQDQPYQLLSTEGISKEVQRTAEKLSLSAVRRIQIRESLWTERTAGSSIGRGNPGKRTKVGPVYTVDRTAAWVQRILDSSQYRASQISACRESRKITLGNPRTQSTRSSAFGSIPTRDSGCRQTDACESDTILRYALPSTSKDVGSVVVCASGGATLSPLSREPNNSLVLEHQQKRSVLSYGVGGCTHFLRTGSALRQVSYRLSNRRFALGGSGRRVSRPSGHSETRSGERAINSGYRKAPAAFFYTHCMVGNTERTARYSDSSFGTTQIIGIEYIGVQEVWDLTVPGDASYVAQGFVNHNSSDMNMQNLPKFLAGWNIKKLFIPDSEDFVIVNVDYKGAEVRVFTAYAKDPSLIKALREGLDMHSFFAHKVFGKPYERYEARDNPAVVPDASERKLLDRERTLIKRVVFGILYGAGPNKIAETIGIDIEEAKAIIALLFKMFPAIKAYAEHIEQEVIRYGFVETHFGRRRRFPLASISRHRGRAVRQARNFKIQSTSSDIVIAQLIEMDEPLRNNFEGARHLLTVHDSLVFQFPKKNLDQLEDFVLHYAEHRVTEKFPWLPVPFKVDIEIGENYGECLRLDKYFAKHPFVPKQEGIIEENELLAELREDAFAAA